MSGPDLQAVVVGAGAAGLSAALELRSRGLETLLLDSGDRPGGVMRSDRQSGFLFERGPNTLMVKGPALFRSTDSRRGRRVGRKRLPPPSLRPFTTPTVSDHPADRCRLRWPAIDC